MISDHVHKQNCECQTTILFSFSKSSLTLNILKLQKSALSFCTNKGKIRWKLSGVPFLYSLYGSSGVLLMKSITENIFNLKFLSPIYDTKLIYSPFFSVYMTQNCFL